MPMKEESVYQLALSRLPRIGPVQVRLLIEHLGSASAVFHTGLSKLEKIEGMSRAKARAIKAFRDFDKLEHELEQLFKEEIIPLFLTDNDYPRRLLHCYDPPPLLFKKGSSDLNGARMLAVVGTRHHTTYGRQATEKLIADLSPFRPVIVSGLAYGIDAIAHRAAIEAGMSTIAVLAHGLDQTYPAVHRQLATSISKDSGALLSEYSLGTQPDKHHFPARNRIVAGISDAVLVIESGIRGGSMLTAELANGYNRDVFAIPGRINDQRSEGCNFLIRNNKAALINHADDLATAMGWEEKKPAKGPIQKSLFVTLNGEEQSIVNFLNGKPALGIDEINLQTTLSSSTVAAALLSLELKGMVRSLPGKRFQLET